MMNSVYPIHPINPIHPVHPAPHPHGHPVPPHHHNPRHSMVSVVYDTEKLVQVFGDSWPFHIEKIADESPEMKILFALEMGFEIAVNTQLMESYAAAMRAEPAYKFTNPALCTEMVGTLSEKLGVSDQAISLILAHIPDGVMAVIAAAANR